MPSALRAQVALIGLLGVLLIPIGTSSLRGLTHILTCREAVSNSIALTVDEDGVVTPLGSQVITRGDDSDAAPTLEVCGGLRVSYEVAAEQSEPAGSDIVLSITNTSEYGWHGTVQLDMNGTDIPIDIGTVAAGATASDAFTLHLDRGKAYEISGTLLIGP